MNIGIVGAAADKFTLDGEQRARQLIRELLSEPGAILLSGACHLGGIDIWAEEEADKMKISKRIFPAKTRAWFTGYRLRNLQIAHNSDVVHSIVVDVLPPNYKGITHDMCYHCRQKDHVKSGGCWTARRAGAFGKPFHIHIVNNH